LLFWISSNIEVLRSGLAAYRSRRIIVLIRNVLALCPD